MTALRRFRSRLNRRFYRLLFGLYRGLFPTTARPGRIPAGTVRRLLVARTDRVGDIVVFTPALSYLREALPHAEIDVVASGGASLLAGDSRVDHVHRYEPGVRGWIRAVRALRARRYDVVLTVRLRDHLYEGIFAALIAPRHAARVSARRPPQYVGLFTNLVRVPHSQRHILARLLYVARAAVGDDAGPLGGALGRYSPTLVTDPAAEARADALVTSLCGGRPFVAFNAWGSDARRCFGDALATEIVVQIAERHPDLLLVLTPPPQAAAEADAIAGAAGARAGAQRVTVAPPTANLHDLVSLLRRAAVVVTPDTANMHIAAAVGAPLLAVYTSVTEVDVWGAWGSPRHVLHVRDERPLRDVAAADVVRAFDTLRAIVRTPHNAVRPAEGQGDRRRG